MSLWYVPWFYLLHDVGGWESYICVELCSVKDIFNSVKEEKLSKHLGNVKFCQHKVVKVIKSFL